MQQLDLDSVVSGPPWLRTISLLLQTTCKSTLYVHTTISPHCPQLEQNIGKYRVFQQYFMKHNPAAMIQRSRYNMDSLAPLTVNLDEEVFANLCRAVRRQQRCWGGVRGAGWRGGGGEGNRGAG